MIVLILATTIPSFSQSVTKNKYTCIPDQVAEQVVIDLQKYDTLQVRYEQQNQQLMMVEKRNEDLRTLIQKYGNRLQECSTALDETTLALNKAKEKQKKQRRWLRLLSFISITSLIYTTTQ